MVVGLEQDYILICWKEQHEKRTRSICSERLRGACVTVVGPVWFSFPTVFMGFCSQKASGHYLLKIPWQLPVSAREWSDRPWREAHFLQEGCLSQGRILVF